jgi:hypothetical protein
MTAEPLTLPEYRAAYQQQRERVERLEAALRGAEREIADHVERGVDWLEGLRDDLRAALEDRP